MAKLTEVVEVSTTAVHPSEVLTGEAVEEFKRVCAERGLTVDDDPQVVMTTFVVGQKARFNVTAECSGPGKQSVPTKSAKPEV